VQHARIVGDLAEGEQQEAHVHALHNGPQPRHRRTHTHALRDRVSEARTEAELGHTMKLYSQMGVSSSRNSPYFLYRSYVTCGRAQESLEVGGRGA